MEADAHIPAFLPQLSASFHLKLSFAPSVPERVPPWLKITKHKVSLNSLSMFTCVIKHFQDVLLLKILIMKLKQSSYYRHPNPMQNRTTRIPQASLTKEHTYPLEIVKTTPPQLSFLRAHQIRRFQWNTPSVYFQKAYKDRKTYPNVVVWW